MEREATTATPPARVRRRRASRLRRVDLALAHLVERQGHVAMSPRVVELDPLLAVRVAVHVAHRVAVVLNQGYVYPQGVREDPLGDT